MGSTPTILVMKARQLSRQTMVIDSEMLEMAAKVCYEQWCIEFGNLPKDWSEVSSDVKRTMKRVAASALTAVGLEVNRACL